MDGKEPCVILVTGSPGVGKTAIVSKLKDDDKSIMCVSIGTIMTEIAVARGELTDRDEIKYLPRSRYVSLQEEAWDRVSEIEGIVVVDTHITVEKNGRFLPGIPIKLMTQIKGLSAMIYIDASNEELARRRTRDGYTKRHREMESGMETDVQRYMNLGGLSYYSVHLNIPIYIIYNRDNRLDEAVMECKKAIKEVRE